MFRVVSVLVSLVALFVGLELVVRLWHAVDHIREPPLSYVEKEWGWRPTPDLSISYSRPGYGDIDYSTNRDGFRRFGDPDTSRVKVWAIGDSTTQAYHVSDGRAYYDYLAANDPGIEVFAFGVGGYGTLQETLVLEHYLDRIRPDVVLWQLCSNDLVNNDWTLELASTENNNHMLRPYLEDGRVVARHPDGRLGWLARGSLLVRRLLVLRNSVRKRTRGSVETDLHIDHPDLRRSVATTRRLLERAMAAAPGVSFVAFASPVLEHAWEVDAFAEICSIDALHCVPGLDEALAGAEQAGIAVDGGADAHWNAAGHEVAGGVLLDYLRREILP